MAGAAGIAIRGAGKALLKGKVKPKVKGAYPATRSKGAYPKTKSKGYPKAGDKWKGKWKGVMGPIPPGVKAPKIPSIKKTTRDIGKGALYITAGYFGTKKIASDAKKRHESKKEKLTKSVEEHKKKTKEKRERK